MPRLSLRKSWPAGFSLIELVIVVVIIAIIGVIAIPKMSRGAAGAGDSSLVQDLTVLRSALDLYQTENGGTYPSVANVVAALTTYSDGAGHLSATNTAPFVYGPYLHSVPPLPLGANKGKSGIDIAGNPMSVGIGWIYNPSNGQINANTTTEADANGTLYNTY